MNAYESFSYNCQTWRQPRCPFIIIIIIIIIIIFETGSQLCHPVWNAVAQSQLTVASTFQAQVILPTQPPQFLDYRGVPPHLANFLIFVETGVLLCCPCWSTTLGLKQSTHISFPKYWDYRREPLHSAENSYMLLSWA